MEETKQIEKLRLDTDKYIFVKNGLSKLLYRDLFILIINFISFVLVYVYLPLGVLQFLLLIGTGFVSAHSLVFIVKYQTTLNRLQKTKDFLMEKIKKYNL